jgi:RNA polymerase sigma factor (sigma-70 family)
MTAHLTTKSDAELIEELQRGNQKAINFLITNHEKAFSNFLFSILGDGYLVEEAMQNSYIKAFQAIEKGLLKNPSLFKSYLFKIGLNEARTYLRKEKGNRTVRFDFDTSSLLSTLKDLKELNPEQAAIKNQTALYLQRFINKLCDEEREVVLLRNYLDLPFSKIACLTGRTVAKSTHLFRCALVNLRMMYKTVNQ